MLEDKRGVLSKQILSIGETIAEYLISLPILAKKQAWEVWLYSLGHKLDCDRRKWMVTGYLSVTYPVHLWQGKVTLVGLGAEKDLVAFSYPEI